MYKEIIRKTEPKDIEAVLKVYDMARAFMRSTGNVHQWNNGYPSRESLQNDMAQGNSYVVEQDGNVAATFFLKVGEEPTYIQIYEGEWLNSNPYGVIHRAASNGALKGVMKKILDFALAICPNIRIDTHRDNKVMQNALLRYGFSYCGIIYLANGDERLAYQFSFHK